MTKKSSDNFVEIGFFKKPFGLKGHLRFHQHSPESRTIFNVSKIFIDSNEFIIKEVKNDTNSPIIKIDKIDNKEDASHLSNKKVYISEIDLPNAPKDKFNPPVKMTTIIARPIIISNATTLDNA